MWTFGLEGVFTQLKLQQWKPAERTHLVGGYSWSRMFIVRLRLSHKWKYVRIPFFSTRMCELLFVKHCFSKYFSDHYLGVQARRENKTTKVALSVMRDSLTANCKQRAPWERTEWKKLPGYPKGRGEVVYHGEDLVWIGS